MTESAVILIAALRADAVFIQRNAAQRAAVNLVLGLEFCGSCIDAAGKGNLCDVQLILQEIVDNLNHAFDRHGFLRHDEAAIGIRGRKSGLKRRALHDVVGRAVSDALLFIDVENRREKGIVLPQDKGVVKIFQNGPSRLLNFIAGKQITNRKRTRQREKERRESGKS